MSALSGSSSDISGNKTGASGNVGINDTSKTTPPMEFSTFLYKMYNESNTIFLVMFIVIYLISYLILGLFFSSKNGDISTFQLRLSRFLDLIFLVAFLAILSTMYYSSGSSSNNEILFNNMYNAFTSYVNSSLSVFSTLFFIVIFYTMIYLFGIPMAYGAKPIFILLVESLAWLLLMIVIFSDFFKYILHINLIDAINSIFNITSTTTNSIIHTTMDASGSLVDLSGSRVDVSGSLVSGSRVDVSVSTLSSMITSADTNEVFNIGNNLYTYDDAQAICSSYGANIATYDQIEEAYKQGGEWCNYGWSDGQMIFFPTQKKTWDKLQKSSEHKNDCGRPGINGGYIANPYMKFGVNCFGKKPTATSDDVARLNARASQVQPNTAADMELDKKVQFWKENASKMLQINSFNTKQWSEW
jgi:hypothetical protein